MKADPLREKIQEFYNNYGNKGLSSIDLAYLFLEANPDIEHQAISLKRYFNQAKLNNLHGKSNYEQVKADILKNQTTATEAFIRPSFNLDNNSDRVSNLDTNPLGVLPEDDMNKTFFDIPETYSDYKAPKKLDAYGKRMGIISDIHLPIHDRAAVLAAHSYVKKLDIDCLLLLGDILDCANLTRHAKKKMLSYTWREELEVGKAYFKSLRILFPDIPILYQLGNHECWFEQYIVRQAPELNGAYILGSALELEKYNIELIADDQLMTYGNLWLHHGHVFSGGGKFVANSLLDKYGVNLFVGHFHREQTASKRNLDNSTHAAWVNGCLSDLHPNYNPHNNYTHGFSTVDLLPDGNFQVKQYKVINGKVLGE